MSSEFPQFKSISGELHFPVDLPNKEALDHEAVESPTKSILRQTLKPIYHWLDHAEIEEIAINRPGELWQRLRKPINGDQYWIRHEAPELTRQYLTRISHQIANSQNVPDFSEDGMPVVFGTIPGGHRFAAGIGANIQFNDPDHTDDMGSICICIRRHVKGAVISLESLKIRRGEAATESVASIFNKKNDPEDAFARIYNALTRGDHILISGATGSGKTSLITRLINEISANKRIITVEDTRELTVPGLNRVHIKMSRTGQPNKMTYSVVRDLIVRMTPDIVMAGEISNFNAATVWELMTTGHGHFMTTIHAESPEEAITTFINCISNSRANAGNSDTIDRNELKKSMMDKLRIIQMKNDTIKGRHISGIF